MGPHRALGELEAAGDALELRVGRQQRVEGVAGPHDVQVGRLADPAPRAGVKKSSVALRSQM